MERFESRKRRHLELSLDREMQSTAQGGFDEILLEHDALPELDFDEVELTSSFVGRSLATPFFISGMTAGHAEAPAINLRLAKACAARGWIFGVGSQRRELDSPVDAFHEWLELKSKFPTLVILGNIGLSQAISTDVGSLRRLAKNLGADAFCVHLNALQEVIQPEGTPNFRGGLAAIERLVAELGVPLILKETGCGFSAKTLQKVASFNLAAIDVSGLGGTHWGRIEGRRALEGGDALRSNVADTFRDWGVSTVDSVISAREILTDSTEIWASGGVRSGLDAAKAIALGANRVGFAKPALQAALAGENELHAFMEKSEFELRTALFCTGSLRPSDLREFHHG
ncbi:MAG: type 2 isopentenyl-diphosphate Delta-isomerase [Cryobacterium sp.]|nr:type 2 isopentenyl-diphosphate Delta-isomerase [Oligoflexia bacterium]